MPNNAVAFKDHREDFQRYNGRVLHMPVYRVELQLEGWTKNSSN